MLPWQLIIRFHEDNYHIHYFLARVIVFESRKCTVDSFISFFSYFCHAFCCHAVTAKGRVYQRDRRCSLFLSLSSLKRAEMLHCLSTNPRVVNRTENIYTRRSWWYRSYNSKSWACETCRLRAASRVCFECGKDCFFPTEKKNDAVIARFVCTSYVYIVRIWERGLFVSTIGRECWRDLFVTLSADWND